nr:SspE [Streptomyces spiramyceticus]
MPPIIVATCCPVLNSPSGSASTVPTHSMPGTRGEGHPLREAEAGVQLGAVQAEGAHRDTEPARRGCGIGSSRRWRFSTGPGPVRTVPRIRVLAAIGLASPSACLTCHPLQLAPHAHPRPAVEAVRGFVAPDLPQSVRQFGIGECAEAYPGVVRGVPGNVGEGGEGERRQVLVDRVGRDVADQGASHAAPGGAGVDRDLLDVCGGVDDIGDQVGNGLVAGVRRHPGAARLEIALQHFDAGRGVVGDLCHAQRSEGLTCGTLDVLERGEFCGPGGTYMHGGSIAQAPVLISSSAGRLTGCGVPVRSMTKSGMPRSSARARASSAYPAREKNTLTADALSPLSHRHSTSRRFAGRVVGSTWATRPGARRSMPDAGRSGDCMMSRNPSHLR